MAAVTRQWHLLPHNRQAIEALASASRISPIVAQLLLNRGVNTASEATRFLDAPLNGLHAPEDLPGVREAVARIASAIRAKRRICVYGDYDVDGTTGTAILWGLITRLGGNAEYYVPHRLDEGYGLNIEALRTLHQSGVELVVTVDCGIAGVAEAAEAKRLGLELIITDHHEFKATLPDAAVLVHPRLPGTSYPFGWLSGAGVAFKVAWLLAKEIQQSDKVTPPIREFLMDSLCLATLGLVADVVPLQGENRIYVRAGLKRLNEKPPLGIRALMASAKMASGDEIRSGDIGFKLGPRINAAGRLGCARLVVDLFTTTDERKAQELATFLDSQNSERQTRERRMIQLAKESADAMNWESLPGIVISRPLSATDWHAGILGIVAGRMVGYTGRPVIVLGHDTEKNMLAGSGRSIPGFALQEALEACASDLVTFGGHTMAVGLRLLPEKLDSFRARFNEYTRKHFPSGKPADPVLRLDAELPLHSLSPRLLKDIDSLEPFGEDNPRPQFLVGGVQVSDTRRMGGGERHLSFKVRQNGTQLRAVAWSMGDRLDELLSGGGNCCLAFTPKINRFMGESKVELEVLDFQPQAEARIV